MFGLFVVRYFFIVLSRFFVDGGDFFVKFVYSLLYIVVEFLSVM